MFLIRFAYAKPLPVRQVIEFCKFHVESNAKVDDRPAKTEDEIKQWDSEFVKVDQTTLFDLILVSRVPAWRLCVFSRTW